MSWTVHVHRDAERQLRDIPPDRRKRILADLVELEGDPFRGLVKPLKGYANKGLFRKVSGRYRIIFKPIYPTRVVEVLAILLRNESTYR